jgi:ankyrin repeat protein
VKKFFKILVVLGISYAAIYIAFSNSQAGGLVLQLAAKKNSEALINLCVLLGADVNEKNTEGLTALHVAGYLGSEHSINALIAKGADINERDNENRTALHLAAYEGKFKAVESLLRHGAHKEIVEKTNGMTALHLAVVKGAEDVVRIFIENNANINAQSKDGVTPLLIARHEKKTAIANLLEENGARE